MRLPLETGTQRLRGFGYAEFNNINDLKEALLLKGEVWWGDWRVEGCRMGCCRMVYSWVGLAL